MTTPIYRRPKFLEILLEIRRDMAHEADYDVDLFAEIARSGVRPPNVKPRTYSPYDESEDVPKSSRAKRAAGE